MNALKSLGVGAFSAALILLVVFGGYNLLALNLGTVSGDYFKGALAVVVLLGGAWLSMQGIGFIGKPFMVGATLVLTIITVRHRAPGVVELASQTSKEVDRSAKNAAINLSLPREVPCDRTTPKLPFFDRETGRALVWAAETEEGRIICFDRSGHHPQTNKDLVAVDERLAAVILRQAPPVPERTPAPTVTPIPATPAPQPTPLPELGEPHFKDLGEGPIH